MSGASKQALARAEQEATAEKDLERYIREEETTLELRAEYEEREREREKALGHEDQFGDDGPERPPPKMTK